MKITNVEAILIGVPYEHGGPKLDHIFGPSDRMGTLLVRIDTDVGVTGWGEAFGLGLSPVTHAALTHVLGPLCVGQDPAELQALMGVLRRRIKNAGSSGPVRYALSGIEIALWDIAGKIRERPLYDLFGGAKRQRIPTYASFLSYGNVAELERALEAAIERGYSGIKLHEHTIEPVVAARRTVGSKIALMLDTNCAWNLEESVQFARQLESADLLWLEEPIFPPADYDSLAALRSKTTVKIAAGENVGNIDEVRRVVKLGALDILQPDVAKIGGLGEMREAIDIALAAGMRVQPHSPFFGPAIIATLHVLATLDADALCERFYCDLEASVLGEATSVYGGEMLVPQGPGLGITIDQRVIDHYRVI